MLLRLRPAARPILLALALLLVGLQTGHAGEPQSAAQKIQVHGHWTITVLDPDGSVVTRREFDNALTGAYRLTLILGRQVAHGYWLINAGAPAGQEVCEDPAGTPASVCVVTEATDPTVGNNRFPTLSVTVGPVGTPSLTLDGTFIAQRSGTIDSVETGSLGCTPATSPNDCATGLNPLGGVNSITSTSITPVPVVLGQQVVISVEITFS